MLNLSWHEVCEILYLSSLTRDQTYVPCIRRWVLNCWTSKEVPPLVIFEWLGFTGWIWPCLWFPKELPYSTACFEPSFWAFISFFFLPYYLLSDYLFGISPWPYNILYSNFILIKMFNLKKIRLNFFYILSFLLFQKKMKIFPFFLFICFMMFAFFSLSPDFGLILLDKIYLNRSTGNISSIWQASRWSLFRFFSLRHLSLLYIF